jgi:hypothetical protein
MLNSEFYTSLNMNICGKSMNKWGKNMNEYILTKKLEKINKCTYHDSKWEKSLKIYIYVVISLIFHFGHENFYKVKRLSKFVHTFKQ